VASGFTSGHPRDVTSFSGVLGILTKPKQINEFNALSAKKSPRRVQFFRTKHHTAVSLFQIQKPARPCSTD
jgi:hypothetical protein